MNELKNELMLSVSMITYKHKSYIKQAVEGVLMQETNFEFQLILCDDCSPDATTQIVQDLIDNHPKGYRINYFRHNKNIGMHPNGLFAAKHWVGKYIALCEGDDYWTDPLKLQKQVDFLEANPEYVIHSGNAIQLHENIKQNKKPILSKIINQSFELDDFLSNNNIITCTVVFRNIKFQFPDNFKKVIFGDWFLYVILMKNSELKVYRSMELFADYRVHSGGVMSNLSVLDNCNAHILQITTIYKYVGNKKMKSKELNTLNNYFIQKYRLLLVDKKYFAALKTFSTNFRYCLLNMPFRKYISGLKHSI